MSEFVAGAFVDVKPDAKNFRTDLQRQIDNQIKTAIKIPVELDPKRFKSTVNAAAKQAPAKVPIIPGTSVAELRKAIKDKIDSATKGLKVKVPIEVEQTGAGSRGGTTTATGGGTGATRRTSAAAQATKATKQLTDAEKQQIQVDNALLRSQQQLAIANHALGESFEPNISAEERIERLRASRSASTRAAKAANDVLAVSEAKLTDSQRRSLEGAAANATALRAEVIEKQKAAKVDASVAVLQDKTTNARVLSAKAMAIEIKEVKTLTELKAVETSLTSLEARLKAQATAARKLGATAIANENAALLARVELQKEAILTQRAELKGESVRARQQKTSARGFASTILSLLGIRGATLAASSAFLAGAVSAAVFVKGLASFARFETELNVFQATAGATAEQMKTVAAEARALGRDITLPGVSSADAASAMSELARAGLSVRDSIAGARGVLQLAAAAQISNADAATLAASALNAFGLSGDKAVHVADLLANAANSSQGSISEMGAALQQASAIARQVGFSLEDTVATLTILARNGLRGSDAGTSLRTALSRLIAPTKQASDLIEALGLNLRDVNGNLRPDIFVQFGQATKNLSPELRDMIAQTIAGQDAIRAFSIGAREGARGLKLTQLQMAATGSAAQLAAARSKGLAGGFSALQSNTETLGTSLGRVAAGPMADFIGGLNTIVTDLSLLASGDTSSFFANLGNEFADMGRGAKQSAKDVNDFFEGIATADPQRALGGLKSLLSGGLLQAPKEAKSEILSLQEELTNLQNLRVRAFQEGFNIKPFTEKIKAIQAQLRAAKVDAGEIIPVTKLEKQLAPLQEIYDQAQLVRKSLVARGADTTFIDKIASDALKKMNALNISAAEKAKKIKQDVANAVSGTEIAKAFEAQFKLIAGNIDLATPEVLSGLNKLALRIKSAAPATGAAGAEIGKRLMESITKAIEEAVANDDPDLAASLKALANKIAVLFGTGLGEAFKNIKVPLTDEQLTDALLPERIASARAEAFGSVGDQIRTKKAELDALNKQLKDVVKGSDQEEKILNAIAAKKAEIRSLRESQASDQKEADQKSDKRITDAISDREQSLLNNLTKAQANESLKNDIAAQVALRNFYTAQISVVKATVRDAETRREQIDALEQKLFDINNDLDESRKNRRQQIREKALKPIDDAAARADETETLKDDVKQASRRVVFWKNQVKVVKRLVKERKATGDELTAAEDALDAARTDFASKRKARRDQVRDQREESLQLDISFAQTTENKNAEIAARRRFIAFLEGQKKFVRGNINKLKELRNEIAEQKKAIKDLNDEAKDTDATSAFELLQQAAETFRANAGNLIGGDQPFAGPAGFTADLAQFLRRQAKSTLSGVSQPPVSTKPIFTVDTTTPTGTTGAGKVVPLEIPAGSTTSVERNRVSVDRLTNSIDRLTNVIERQPGTGTVNVKKAKPAGIQRSERNHFATATAARRVVENRTGI